MADIKPQDLASAAAGVSDSLLRPICRDSGNYLANALWDMRAIVAAQVALLDAIEDAAGNDIDVHNAQRVARVVLRKITVLANLIMDTEVHSRHDEVARELCEVLEVRGAALLDTEVQQWPPPTSCASWIGRPLTCSISSILLSIWCSWQKKGSLSNCRCWAPPCARCWCRRRRCMTAPIGRWSTRTPPPLRPTPARARSGVRRCAMADDVKPPLRMVSNSSGNDDGIERLRATVQVMDCMSQGGFSRIAAIADLAMRSLETTYGAVYLENVVAALKIIRLDAIATRDTITAEARKVGCGYIDAAERRRQDAYYAAAQAEAHDDDD